MALFLVLVSGMVFAADAGTAPGRAITLTVPAGVPLRLYLTKRIPKRLDAPVEGRLLAPVYAFDHEVIPAGTLVRGRVSHVQPVSRWERTRAVVGGDFTPLRDVQVEFTMLQLDDGRILELHSIGSAGLNSLAPVKPPKQRQPGQTKNGGILGTGKRQAKDALYAQVARIKSIPDIVRGPGKKEWLFDYAMSRLPYHPQYVRNRTRFDVELLTPLDFGSETIPQDALAFLGSQPAPGSIVHARLVTPLD